MLGAWYDGDSGIDFRIRAGISFPHEYGPKRLTETNQRPRHDRVDLPLRFLSRQESRRTEMSNVIHTLSAGRFNRLVMLFAGATLFVVLTPVGSHAQRPRAAAQGDGDEATPSFSDFKGVRIGMSAEESRKKLGSPRDKGDDQDFYIFNDNEAVQVFFDKAGAVTAISVDFMSGATGIPAAKDVLGTNAEAKPDGSIYKMIRYPKAGYWVSYSRTSGDSPTITITMQKIQQ
jgi:hypothetical protein